MVREQRVRSLTLDIGSLVECLFQGTAEHRSGSFPNFEASKKLLSACYHICTVQVYVRILLFLLNNPAEASKAS